MNDRAHFERVDALFRAACALSRDAQQQFLAEHCGLDDELRREIESLLRADGGMDGPLDAPPAFATSFLHQARANPMFEAELPGHIAGYRIIRRLGAGGMGVVFEAEQATPRRMVALKVISPGLVSRSMLRRFQFETEMLGRLQHPGIAQIYAAGTFDAGAGAQPFFAMELVNGTPLMEFATARDLSIRDRLELLVLLCDAVQHAHQRGVIHRDLKPANVIVTDTGQPKILDFGVARATDADVQVTTLQTSVGQIIGTVPYMSPEQAAGAAHGVDTRSDVYSLGVLGYELLTGRLPLDVRAKLLHEALRSVREDAPTPISTHSRLLAGDLATIISKALEKDKVRRYQSAADFAADVRNYLDDKPIAARPPSRMYQLRMLTRRHRAAVGAGAIAAAALVVATIVSISFAISESHERALAERRFDDVRALANAFLFDIDDQLQSIAGSTPVRQSIVSTALTYLDRLAADAGHDPALLDELAEAYVRVGDIQGYPNLPNVGDMPAALDSYRKSLDIRLALGAHAPDAHAHQRKLAALHERMGTLQAYLGEPNTAVEEYGVALAINVSLLTANSNDLELRRDHMRYVGMLGDTHRQMGRLEEARACFARELESARMLTRIDPDPARAQRALSIACNDLGSVLASLGAEDEALRLFEEALAIREDLAAASPDDVRAQRDLFAQ